MVMHETKKVLNNTPKGTTEINQQNTNSLIVLAQSNTLSFLAKEQWPVPDM